MIPLSQSLFSSRKKSLGKTACAQRKSGVRFSPRPIQLNSDSTIGLIILKHLILLGELFLDKGKLSNLLKETEKGLFRVNKQLRETNRLAPEIEILLQNLTDAEQAASGIPETAKELRLLMQKTKVVGQSRELFNQIDVLGKNLSRLSESSQKVSAFVEMHRTSRLYSFDKSTAAVKFAKHLMEAFSLESILFKPRFMGTLDLSDVSQRLNLKKEGSGLLLNPKDLKPFVNFMAEKKFASNISLEASNLKMQWQDKKTIAVEAPVEKLFATDRLCDVLHGKCVEK